MRRLLLAVAVFASACGPGEDTEELRAFLAGQLPPPPDAEALGRLNSAFARQAVRGSGYVASGVDASNGDVWSPVVLEDGRAGDVSPWVGLGTIDAEGRFAPPLPAAPVEAPAAPLELELKDERAQRVAAALAQLQVTPTRIEWEERAPHAIRLDGAVARVNPLLLHLVPAGAAAASLPAPGSGEGTAGEGPGASGRGGLEPVASPRAGHTPNGSWGPPCFTWPPTTSSHFDCGCPYCCAWGSGG